MIYNRFLLADSYKASHYMQYPEGTQKVFSYIESRGGLYDYNIFFGLQAFIKEYLLKPITREEVLEANEIITAHGEPFNLEGALDIVDRLGGKFPVQIRALPEGTRIKNKNMLVSIVNTDDKHAWVVSYLETALLRAIWYPTQVASLSNSIRRTILKYLEETGTPEAIDFKVQDFGARGCSSTETSMLGGMAHLVSFNGTDNMTALVGAKKYYGEPMAGFSIPASEHSSMTCLGREGEVAQFKRMLTQFGGKYPLIACVSDGFDIYNACENIWGGVLKEDVLKSGSTLVVRPDSGEPVEITGKIVEILGQKFGYTKNEKGFKVLNPAVRIIQGDGIDELMIHSILGNFKAKGWSADNIAFGMGGKLLQAAQRDDNKWAMKCSAIKINGVWKEVYKDPITDKGKTSKKGLLALNKNQVGEFVTTNAVDENDAGSEMRIVYQNGELLVDENFNMIRERARAM